MTKEYDMEAGAMKDGCWYELSDGTRLYCIGTNLVGEPVIENPNGATWFVARDSQCRQLLDCDGWDWKEPEPIDPYSAHELLDRLSLMCSMMDTFFHEHSLIEVDGKAGPEGSAIQAVNNLVIEAGERLAEAYRIWGEETL